MVTDAELRSGAARFAPLWLAIGLSGHAAGFAWAAFGSPTASMAPYRSDGTRSDMRPLTEDDMVALRARLRGNDPYRRARAEARLRDAGSPVDFDRQQNLRPSRAAGSAELLDAWVEVRGDELAGAVTTYFAPELFAPPTPDQARASTPALSRTRVVVRGDALTAPITLEFPASAGDARLDRLTLASAAPPGRYEVDIVLVASWADASGELREQESHAATLSVERPGRMSMPGATAAAVLPGAAQ